ncbi:zinc metallopeptidase [Halomonas urumqiensis]|uniref:Peptidase n=1 Tax=Halomonas urumqiensis TaxID=1684789 RepID=A0A2N7UCR0_9GAMM|nr:zinc metallopeptidase [Halomonas urumqiensis]PMR78210.1 peptidase [Halomonas urumqiensis]PTB03358.1 peptidase [Halomonas urumqiensis]GHE20476.1 neutral zinc metallopeptidase [Halomonas urumqiensis]
MIVVAVVLLLALFLLPNVWAKWVISRHARGRDDYPGTGGELAEHLLRRLGIDGVEVEMIEQGDHYDPQARRVRLSRDIFQGRSLTAVTVAAHEVGHAIQHHQGYAPLLARTRLVGVAQKAEKLGAVLMMAAPLLFLLTRVPGGMAVVVAAAVISFGTAALVHLVTLPVEFDASFQRALPLLKEYVPPYDMPGARHVLTACAFTYVAASLASILNLGRWLVILRR